MIEISKELLSEVLGEKVENIVYSSVEKYRIDLANWCYKSAGYFSDGTISVTTQGNTYDMSIYELVYNNLKQWAYNKGFKIISGERLQDINALFIIEITDMKYNLVYREFHKSEIEAIVKASEWVLKEIKR